jgi:virginiamycin B lyase
MRIWTLVASCLCAPLGVRAQATDDLQTVRHSFDSLPISARFRLPTSPDWLAAGFGAIWVVNYDPSALHRLDPKSDSLVATIPLGDDACLGIAVGPRSLWVPSCGTGELNEIDPNTNTVLRRYRVRIGPGREGALAYAEGSVWLPINRPDTTSAFIARINPKNGSVVATIPVPPRSDVVVAGFGAVWVTSSDANMVVRIDPRVNTVVARIAVGASPKFMAVGTDALWVQNRADGSVSRLDPATNRERARVQTSAPTKWGDLASGPGGVWLSVNGRPVTRIDPQSNRVTHQFVGGEGADAIREAFGSLWVADHKHGEVWRIPVAHLGP